MIDLSQARARHAPSNRPRVAHTGAMAMATVSHDSSAASSTVVEVRRYVFPYLMYG